MSSPTVAVVLTSFNSGSMVEAMLDSVLAQTLLPDEIVVSDDASTDGTGDRIRRYLADHADGLGAISVRLLLDEPWLGLSGNFERALRAATADLVAIADHDDLWEPEHLEVLRAQFLEDPSLHVVASDATVIDEDGVVLAESLHATIGLSETELASINGPRPWEALVRRPLMTTSTMMVRRQTAAASLPLGSDHAQDEWVALLCASAGRARLLQERLTRYRQHAMNRQGVATTRTLTWKAARLFELTRCRRESNRTAIRRALARRDGLDRLGASADPRAIELVSADVDHELWRTRLPRLRLFRVPTIAAAVRAGNYDRFDRGLRDAVRDLVARRHR